MERLGCRSVAGLAVAADGERADLVVHNARVFTGDPRRPAAGSVAIGGGQILNVSDDHRSPGT